MIEGFWKIGEEIISKKSTVKDIVEHLVLDIDEVRDEQKQYIAILKFNLYESKIDFDIELKEISKETCKNYLWVGNPPGSNSPQDRLTTNNIKYLVSQTVPNLITKLPDTELKNLLVKFKNVFYSTRETQNRRYRYVWDISKIDYFQKLTPTEIENILKKESRIEDIDKKTVEFVSDKILEFIKDKTSITSKEISLFTICINGKILAQDDDYKEYIYSSLIDEVFNNTKKGTCSICNKNGDVTCDTTKFWFKFYITDKIGFSSNLLGKKGFFRNYTLCKSCYEALLVSQTFIRNNLRSYLSGYTVYIIPTFYLTSVPVRNLEKWMLYFKDKFTATATLEGWHEFQKKLEDYKDYENSQDEFMLNFLFSEKKKAEFKIYQLVQDVTPSRLDELITTNIEVSKIFKDIFIGKHEWNLSLGKMYYLFSDERKSGETSKFILQFYNSLFSSVQLSYTFLVHKFLNRVFEIRFSDEFDEIKFCDTILHQVLLILYLRKLNLLKGGHIMEKNLSDLEVSDDIKKFFNEAKYTEPMIALFLLGKLIGEIGSAQYRKGDDKKSILNKINFQGMHLNKVGTLYNEIFEKMRHYRVLNSETEKLYGLSKILFEKHMNDWNLSFQENTFFILTGYAFHTLKVIKSGVEQEKNNKPQEVNTNE